MKKIPHIFSYALCLAFFAFTPNDSFAQANSSADWMRVQSDDGEFSVEVPVKYNYLYDREGFWTSKDQSNYRLQKMSMLNAYFENALVGFESFEATKSALDALFASDARFPKESEIFTFERDGVTIRQITTKTNNFYCIRQYFNSKNRIYILTAASRNENATAIQRFLNSLIFKPDGASSVGTNPSLFSSLKVSRVSISDAKEKEDEKPNHSPASQLSSEASKLTIVKKPISAYVDNARMKGIKGTIRFRITFGDNGFIPSIEIVKSLPEGLTRQALFAALRLKFLPEEKGGKAIPTTKTVEYAFSLY